TLAPEPTSTAEQVSTSAVATTDAPTTTVGTPPAWVRPCVDAVGSSDVEPVDTFAGEEFGPLGLEPGLQIVYPIGEQAEGWSTPVSSVLRVPGGTLVSLTSNGPVVRERVVAVVDDSGSVRWRRCLGESYGWTGVVDEARGVVFLEDTPGGVSEREWSAFDLRTGESRTDVERSADELDAIVEARRAARTDVGFGMVGGETSTSGLQRVDDAGNVIWERSDLTPMGGEGFRSTVTEDDVVLAAACVGSPVDWTSSEWPPCPIALLGLDLTDGHTLWQWDGPHGPTLIAGHYAIVSGDFSGNVGDLSSSVMIDTRTGDVVPGAVSDDPRAFLTECCGGYDYNRVESEGAVAWSVATYVLNVWFPAGASGQGQTVDLFGPSDAPHVQAHVLTSVGKGADCDVDVCLQVSVAMAGLEAGRRVEVSCRVRSGGVWAAVESPATPASVSGDGSAYLVKACFVEQGTEAVQVFVGGELASNVVSL
ncbi:MAG: hypothetical protein RJB65_1620, partial [Actinomycetota bacterium]